MKFYSTSSAQPEMFQGRRDFVELGQINKHFVNNATKKAPQVKM